MKRTKRLIAVLAIATIALSSTVAVYAEEATAVTTAVAVAAPVAEEKFADLAVTDAHYYGYGSIDYGVYPTSADVQDLGDAVNSMIWTEHSKYANDYQWFYSQGNAFSVNYKVENFNRYALVNVNLSFNKNTVATLPVVESHAYYIDKKSNSIITKETYDAGVKAQADAKTAVSESTLATTTEAKAVVLMQVRKNAETLGLKLEYDAATKATIVKDADGKVLVKYVIGESKYIVGDKTVELDAPVIKEDNFAYVPSAFFTDILKAKVSEVEGALVAVK